MHAGDYVVNVDGGAVNDGGNAVDAEGNPANANAAETGDNVDKACDGAMVVGICCEHRD